MKPLRYYQHVLAILGFLGRGIVTDSWPERVFLVFGMVWVVFCAVAEHESRGWRALALRRDNEPR